MFRGISLQQAPKWPSFLAFSGLSFLFLIAFLSPISLFQGLPLCFYKFSLGIDCPGCGLSRALVALFHGRLLESIRWNALGIPVTLFLLLSWYSHLKKIVQGRSFEWSTPQGRKIVGELFFLLFFGQWLFKLFLEGP